MKPAIVCRTPSILVLTFGLLLAAACDDNGSPQDARDADVAATDDLGPDGPPLEAHIIIHGGRVIDPETGFDELATVGLTDGRIDFIVPDSGQAAPDARADHVIDATGLVVSPGFINTHTHEGTWQESMKAYVTDGITLWIGGNCGSSPTSSTEGTAPVASFLDEMEAAGMVNNFATLVGHNSLRRAAGVEMGGAATPEQVAQMVATLEQEMTGGVWGVSFGSFYDPGATTEEMVQLAQVAADAGGMASSHFRYALMRLASVVVFAENLEEAIDTSRQTGVPLIVSHVTDMAFNDTTEWALDTILDAVQDEGLPLAADIIGYDSFSNDFFTILGFGTIDVATGMALTGLSPSDFEVLEDVYVDGTLFMSQYDRFESVEQAQTLLDAIMEGRAESPRVWCYIVKPEYTKQALTRPFVFMGNDGAVRRDPGTGELDGQPRSIACLSRLFGHWVREEEAISFEEALYKATLAPALWLGLDSKGRLQEGADADITIFDPATIVDRATPRPDEHLLPPEGIEYVIVNGELVLEEGELTGNQPGRVIRRTWTIPGDTPAVLEHAAELDQD